MDNGVDENNVICSPSASKILARGIMELEVRLKKEITESVCSTNQKVLSELNKIQQNCGKILNTLERHDAMLQDVIIKFNHQSNRIDRFGREQEQMRKNIEQLLDNDANCVAASDRLQQAINQRRTVTTGVVSIESSTAWFRRNGVQRNQTRFPPQQRVNQQQQAHFSPGHQFSSTDKMNSSQWTRRGSGVFTSDEEESEVDPTEMTTGVISERTTTTTVITPPTVAAISPPVPLVVISSPGFNNVISGGETNTVSSPLPPVVKAKERVTDTTSETAAERSFSDTSAINFSPQSPAATKPKNLVGGFGNFRRGKPAAIPTKMQVTESPQLQKTNADEMIILSEGVVQVNSKTNVLDKLVCRPLTLDELRVLRLSDDS